MCIYTGTGWYCALVILYFISFLHSIFIRLDPRSLATAYCFLLLSVNQAACGARDDTLVPLFARRVVSWKTGRPADSRTRNHNRGSRGDPRGSSDLPRRGPSGFDADFCGSPTEREEGGKEEGRSDTGQARKIEKTTKVLTDPLSFVSRVLTRTTNERRPGTPSSLDSFRRCTAVTWIHSAKNI